MKITDIHKFLHEIAQNEHEKFKAFRERFVEYCIKNEKKVIMLFRLLKGIEQELSDCLNGHIHVKIDRIIILKVLKTIRTELEIVRYRMKFPHLFVHETTHTPQPVGVWTSDKIDLVELIYAIKMSVNNGNVPIKALQECFEYIFQIKIGNIYKQLGEINKRKKGSKTEYLESLIANLNQVIEELNR